MFLCVKSSSTSCLFFLTLLMTGIRKTREMNREQDAAISRYKKTYMLLSLLESDSLIIASVELFKA